MECIYKYDLSEIKKALNYAEECLVGQTRKFLDKPAISHSKTVVEGLLGYCDQNTVIAGALHDTIEDTKFDKEIVSNNILNIFGAKVLSIILEVTDPEGVSAREAAIHQSKNINSFSNEAKNIKYADKTANIEEIISDYITMYPNITKEYTKFANFYLAKSLAIIGAVDDYSFIHPVLIHRFTRSSEILIDILDTNKE